jgi:hypothetical protein
MIQRDASYWYGLFVCTAKGCHVLKEGADRCVLQLLKQCGHTDTMTYWHTYWHNGTLT